MSKPSVLAAAEALLGSIRQTGAAPAAPAVQGPAPVFAPLAVPTLALPLLDFQREGVEQALKLRRALIADEMGLGKTPQGIACAVAALTVTTKPILVVVPPALRSNWVREFAKFAPNVAVEVLLGTKGGTIPARAQVLIIGDASISGTTVKEVQPNGRTTWTTVLTGWAKDLAGHIGGLVVDECHRFKNYKAKRTVGCQGIADSLPADAIRVLMSGTPIENRTDELISQLLILDRLRGAQHFGSMKAFQDRYCPVVDSYGTRASNHTVELHERLRKICMIRRLRDDVLDLPGKGRIAVALDMDAATARQYAFAEADLRAFLAETRGRLAADRAMRSEAINRLTVLRGLAGRGKLKALIEYVQGLLDQGEQVFIATWHQHTVDVLLAALAAKKVPTVSITGKQNDRQKDAAVQAFQGGEAQVLIGNIKAAGVGFTLTAACNVVMAELPWTPSALKQVEDRLDRIGQTREVVVHVTIAATEGPSIDAHVWGLLEDKAAVVGEVLDGEAEALLEDNMYQSLLDFYREG